MTEMPGQSDHHKERQRIRVNIEMGNKSTFSFWDAKYKIQSYHNLQFFTETNIARSFVKKYFTIVVDQVSIVGFYTFALRCNR